MPLGGVSIRRGKIHLRKVFSVCGTARGTGKLRGGRVRPPEGMGSNHQRCIGWPSLRAEGEHAGESSGRKVEAEVTALAGFPTRGAQIGPRGLEGKRPPSALG